MASYSHKGVFVSNAPTLNEKANMVYNEFVINYIQGEDLDYEGFAESWKDAGGGCIISHFVCLK